MATLFISLKGSLSSGGPTVAAANLAHGFIKRKHKVIYDNPYKADVALCIIDSGKVLRKVDRKKTKVMVRLDGAYFKEYWHGRTPDRKWRPDMDQLHSAIKRDVNNVDTMIYQSQFSKTKIDEEIAERKNNFVIINNGVDTNRFKPRPYKKSNIVKLFHHGVIRNDYIMDSLIDTVELLKKDGLGVELTIVGSMDAVCKKIYEKRKMDCIKYIGPVPNSKLQNFFVPGAIGIYPRQGSSSDNVVVESLAMGCPVIIPKFGGNAEFINNNKQGILVDSLNWDYGSKYSVRLADGIKQIFPDIDGFCNRARKHAVAELTIEKMIDKYLVAMGLGK